MSDGVRRSYDALAERYAADITPIDRKPFDCLQLDRFVEGLRGAVWDLGCGPGDVTRYLGARGVEVVGADLSPGMVREARRLDAAGRYVVADLERLPVRDGALAGVVAFYSLIHLPPGRVEGALAGLRRVLAPGGRVLIAVHAGAEVLHLDTLLEREVDLDFHFHSARGVERALVEAGFSGVTVEMRGPYPDIEAQTERIYAMGVAG